LDEVEKCHPEILTCLLQTFDEGRLTDGKGNTVHCMNAIFIMTSNLAHKEIAAEALRLRNIRHGEGRSHLADGEEDELFSMEFKDDVIQPILIQHFHHPEFVGRITELVFFMPFTVEQLILLSERELVMWRKNAKERHGMDIIWDRSVNEVLIRAFSHRYGARSIQHETERQVVGKLALAHEQGKINRGSKIRLVAVEHRGKKPSVELEVDGNQLEILSEVRTQ
jgi:ATP-dependent Clp protease ATP-binding subunit ClpB